MTTAAAWPGLTGLDGIMVAANETFLNHMPGGLASRRRRSLCRSVIPVTDRPVDWVPSLCHDDRQSRFPLRAPPLPRGSKNFVSSWLCGEKSVSGTQPLVHNLNQGMTLDSVTGLYYERYRNYSPSLGTWISQDPAGYINGADTYQLVMSNPVGTTDPIGSSWYNPASWGWVQGLGQLGAPAANYVANTLTYPGDSLLGLPTNQGLGWGQSSLVVGLIQESPSFQYKSQAWLKQIVAAWSRSEGCKSAHGKIADRRTLNGLSIYNTSQSEIGPYNIIGQLTIGSFVVHAYATGPAEQACRNGGVDGGASLSIQYDVSDPFHLHLGSWEPGQFNQTIHWTGSQYIAIARKC